jgi:hypothetical protein
MKRRAIVSTLAAAAAVACSGTHGSGGFGLDGGGGGSTGPTTQPASSASTTLGGGSSSAMTLAGGDSGASSSLPYDAGPCPYTSGTVDHDGDGWSPADGDCNDCNKYINPGAYDIPGNHIDEDCDGKPDDEPVGCDSALTSVATTNGADGAQAMDLCRTTTSAAALPMKTWGVISAAYVLPDNSPSPTRTGIDDAPCSYSEENFQLGFGILGPTFGAMNKTQQGEHMLGLSSGTARQPTDPGYQPVWGFDKCYTSAAPRGFPGQTPACGGVFFGPPHDGAALQVVLRVPTNALTMSFDSNFFSYEFPEYVCSSYNDTFVVIMLPSPAGEPSTANDNIAFDSKGNIISINAGFLVVCDPTTRAGSQGMGSMAGRYSYACPEGAAKLEGTGFGSDSPATPKGFFVPTPQENHASTDWLTTTVSVAALAGQQITLLFAVWDSSDGLLDTTVLIDNVTWTFATEPNQVPPTMTPPPMTLPK